MLASTGEAVGEEGLHSSLVGMETGVAHMEISAEVPPAL